MGLKQKTCKACRQKFVPSRPMQAACTPACAIAIAERKREKQAQQMAAEKRKEARQRLERIKTRAQWMKEAQAAVNRYVRLRDRDKGCISCDRPATWDGQWHASHFRSVGAASAVRFNLWNIHKACSVCNHHLSGNVAGYTPRLIEKVGPEKVEWLQQQNQIVRYEIEYLKRLKSVFNRRANRVAKMIK
jgi:hypothetical protein